MNPSTQSARSALRSAHQLITAAIYQLDTVEDDAVAETAESLRIAIERVEATFGRIAIVVPDAEDLAARFVAALTEVSR